METLSLRGMGHRARETHTGEALTRPGGIREGSPEERMLGLRSGQKAGSGDSSGAVTASSDPVQERMPELADGTVMADTHRVIPPGIQRPRETAWWAGVARGEEIPLFLSPPSTIRRRRVRPGVVTQPSQPSNWRRRSSAVFPPNMPLTK